MSYALYTGDCREILPKLGEAIADCAIVDPPYGDTSLSWDTQVDGWLPMLAVAMKPNAPLWVFGSMRFLAPLFTEVESLGFRYSQDIVWEKQNGTVFHNDRFRRVHEHAVMFYRGNWRDVFHDAQFTLDARATVVRRKSRPAHTGSIGEHRYVSEDGGPRLVRSVMHMRNEHGRAIHPTQKPVELVERLVRYSCPPGGVVLDCFAGSCTTGVSAMRSGRKSILIEKDVDCAERGAFRLSEFNLREAAA